MGLGGAVEGGTYVYALMLFGIAVVIGPALLWGVRASTGRWLCGARVAGVDGVGRRMAGVPLQPAAEDHRSIPCVHDESADGIAELRGWQASSYGDTGSSDALDRFQAGLDQEGFQTSPARSDQRDAVGRRVISAYVIGTRGSASALVTTRNESGNGKYFLRVEDVSGWSFGVERPGGDPPVRPGGETVAPSS